MNKVRGRAPGLNKYTYSDADRRAIAEFIRNADENPAPKSTRKLVRLPTADPSYPIDPTPPSTGP